LNVGVVGGVIVAAVDVVVVGAVVGAIVGVCVGAIVGADVDVGAEAPFCPPCCRTRLLCQGVVDHVCVDASACRCWCLDGCIVVVLVKWY